MRAAGRPRLWMQSEIVSEVVCRSAAASLMDSVWLMTVGPAGRRQSRPWRACRPQRLRRPYRTTLWSYAFHDDESVRCIGSARLRMKRLCAASRCCAGQIGFGRFQQLLQVEDLTKRCWSSCRQHGQLDVVARCQSSAGRQDGARSTSARRSEFECIRRLKAGPPCCQRAPSLCASRAR